MNKALPDHFCSIPWSSIEIDNLGYYRVCCVSNSVEHNKGVGKDHLGKWKHVLTHDITESLDSSLHNEIREYQLLEKQHSNCSTCWLRDSSAESAENSTGRRVFFSKVMNKATEGAFPSWEDASQDPGIWKRGIVSLDLKLGNICNLQCAHCDPVNSSQWVDLAHKYTGNSTWKVAGLPIINYTKKPNGRYEIQECNWMEDPRWHEQFKRIAPQLRHIYVTGGEPMIVPWHDKMLEYLCESGLSRNIVLEYDSNLTAINPKISMWFSQFKRVWIRASIDGIGDTYEWIRYPSSWNRVSKNILDNKDIIVNVTACIMPYNAWNVIGTDRWIIENGMKPTWRFISTPKHLNLRFFPVEMKRTLIDLYRKDGSSTDTLNAARYLEQSIGDENTKHVLEFINWADFLSESRGKDWRVAFPELSYHLRQYGG